MNVYIVFRGKILDSVWGNSVDAEKKAKEVAFGKVVSQRIQNTSKNATIEFIGNYSHITVIDNLYGEGRSVPCTIEVRDPSLAVIQAVDEEYVLTMRFETEFETVGELKSFIRKNLKRRMTATALEKIGFLMDSGG